MSNALTMFDNNQLVVPAHIASFLEQERNIPDRMSVPTLSYQGKVWTRIVDGEKVKMTRNVDGVMEPVQTLKVIVLQQAKSRGRAYFEGAYDPEKEGKPLCWSSDGNVPDADVAIPQHSDCKNCPMSAKGSKITEQGKAVTACSAHRIIVVVPAAQPNSQPLRCKLAITSLFDKQSPDLEKAGWQAFEQYTDMLRSRGVGHTASVVTKMTFDSNVAYPKVIFSPDRWLTPEEVAVVAPIAKSEEVMALVEGTFNPPAATPNNGFDEGGDAPAAPAPAPAPAPARKRTAPAAAPAPVAPVAQAAPAPAPAAPAPVAPVAQAAPAPAAPAPVAPVAQAAAPADIPQDVADLLADWG